MASLKPRPYDYVKRFLDIASASLGIVILSPVMLVTGAVVAVKLGRPVIFAQERPGRGGRIFTLYKFRSMRSVDARRGWVTDEQRLTRFGQVLRASSLDELPSLWNVLRGDMSFVGPRPLLVEYLPRYTPEQARRHEVRPGITGLAQVSGRNTVDWAERFIRDVQYVEQRSLYLDACVLAATARLVVTRAGITAEGHATMTKFGEPND